VLLKVTTSRNSTFVEKESLEARGLSEDDLLVDVQVMGKSELADLMDDQDVILSF